MSTFYQCRTCGKLLPEEAYPHQKKTGYRGDPSKTTRRLDCRECTAELARAYRATRPTQKRRKVREVDEYLYSACGVRVADAKQRKSTDFDIDKDYMYDLLMKQGMLCAISGEVMSVVKGDKFVISIDKINPLLGYTKGNVQWVTWAVNRAKGDLTMQEFVSMCKSVVRCNDYPEREYTQAGGSASPAIAG